jgi:hypothetical protein
MVVLATGMLVQACTSREVVLVEIGWVSVSPPAASLVEGETLQFLALVADDRGAYLAGADVVWSSDDPEILSITADGLAEAVQRGQATIRAELHGKRGEAIVNVIPGPAISLFPAALSFYGGAGGASPAAQTIAVINGGGGTFTDLTVAVQYATGTGWLVPTLASTTAPTTLTVTPQTAGMPVGVYFATIALSSPDDRNSPVLVPVTLSLTGLTITESDGSTVVDESGTTDDFTVVLGSPPASNVVISVTSDDPGEVTVSPSTLIFTPSNWNQAQTVTVTGVDDLLIDGDQVTAVTVAVDDALSDPAFHGLADSVLVTTTDDDCVVRRIGVPFPRCSL